MKASPYQRTEGRTGYACGIQDDGHRRVLGVSVELSEAEVHWRKFLESLSARGLHVVEMKSPLALKRADR